MQQHYLHTLEDGRKSISDEFVSPLREMYQIRRNNIKIEKQRTDESCNRKSEELLRMTSSSRREIIPQYLQFEEQGRGTATSTNSIAHNYEVKKPSILNIDWDKENKSENQTIKRNRVIQRTNHRKLLEVQQQQIYKTLQSLNKGNCNQQNRQSIQELHKQIDKLFATIKNDYTYTGV